MRMLLLFLSAALCLSGQESGFKPQGPQLPSPVTTTPGQPSWQAELYEWVHVGQADYDKWRSEMDRWRKSYRESLGYNGAEYERPELKWAQRNFIQPQMMVEERYFYDPAVRSYTVDRYLDDVERRYGGIDSLLIWPVYPNIGVDNRNQYDMHRDLPGGVTALREMVDRFHARGVKVFFPAMPWDVGTRDEGTPGAEATARLLTAIGADGVNGDTMAGIPKEYRTASDGAGHPLVLEPELAPGNDAALMWNNQSWGYWSYPFVPLVSKLKWLEPRHLINVCDRWARDHTDDLQFAFFNGAGFESWENIWGIWNGLTPRDAEVVRRIAKIERQFADVLASAEWQPYAATLRLGVFGSRFPHGGATLWTLVNRNEYAVTGAQLRVRHADRRRYFDLWHGQELRAAVGGSDDVLAFEMEGRGYGAVLALDAGADWPGLAPLLAQMRDWAEKPLGSYSAQWNPLPQRVVEIARTKATAEAPQGMVKVPGASFDFAVHGVEIEGSNGAGVDVQYGWEDAPRRMHRSQVTIQSFFMDRYPVTNAQFQRFLQATRYHPADD
jgi:iron(II)-dependent oxidoreductase